MADMGSNWVDRHSLPFSVLLAVPCHSGHALGSSQPFRYFCSEEHCKTRKHQPKETPNNLAPHTGESKRRAPCKHPLHPSARLKTGSIISVRGYQTTLRLLAQKSSAAAGKRWSPAWGSAKKDDFGSTFVLTSHLPCGDKSQQFRCVNTVPSRKLGLVGCSNPRTKTGLELRT